MPAPTELADGFCRGRIWMENLAQRREFYDSAFGECWVSVCDEIRSHYVTVKSVE